MRPETEAPSTRKRSKLFRVAFLLFAPEAGLLFTWLALVVIAGLVGCPTAMLLLMMGGLTLLLVLMLAVAAYMPPTKPFREVSALAARAADLAKVVSGAALFGAAAYSGVVGSMMSRMPLSEAISPAVIWGVIWPILMVATTFGASVVGTRLAWDFRRSGHRARVLALGRLRSWLPHASMRRHFVTDWLAGIVVTGSRTGAFMVVGYLAPVIIVTDIYLLIEYAAAAGRAGT